MKELDRRAFLQGAAASAATVAAGLAPAPLMGSQRQAGVAWERAPCRLCGVGCGLLVAIQRGRAVAVRGDPDSPAGQGLACVKGYHAVQTLYGRDRITRALIRSGGTDAPASLSEALDLVAARLRGVLARQGPGAAALFGGAQWTIPDAYVAAKLWKGALGSPELESSARLEAGSARAGFSASFGLDGSPGCYADIDSADVFVLWNLNLAETDPVLFSRMLARKRRSPAVRIVELTSRTTRTSYPADESLLLAPQSAAAVANAICHELVEERWVRHDFVDRYTACKRAASQATAPAGGLVEELAEPASWGDYVGFLRNYPPDRAQELSGIPAARLRWLASLYGDRSRSVMSLWGRDPGGGPHGTWIHNLLCNIHLLTGKVGTPGNGPFCVNGLNGLASAVHDAGASSDTLPGGLVTDEAARRRVAAAWGLPAAVLPSRPGRAALEVFRALERGELGFLWIQEADPFTALPNLDRYLGAARKRDCFIVVSSPYPTATTDRADVVLPAALWIERGGIIANAERRLQHWDRLVPPPGDAAGNAWLMIEVARRLGHGRLFPWSPENHIAEIWGEYRRVVRRPGTTLPTLAALRAGPGLQWPDLAGREGTRRYRRGFDPAADPARGDFDFYGHSDHRAWIWLRPHEPAAEAPDREYPFWLSSGPVLEHSGTGMLTRRVPTLHRSIPQAYVELHREDAAELGIRNGERVRLLTRRGALELAARIDYRAQPARGVLLVPGFDETHPVQRLLPDASCPVSGQPTGWAAARVERVSPARGSS
jgi:nitrate reductase NapA